MFKSWFVGLVMTAMAVQALRGADVKLVDKTWIEAPEYSGSGFGHMHRFPPEAITRWRAAMDAALEQCRTIIEYRRVKLADESLRLFEMFMQLRRDLAEGRWNKLEHDSRTYLGWMTALSNEYSENYTFAKARWAWGGSVNTSYFRSFYKFTYDDAARIADRKKYTILLRSTKSCGFASVCLVEPEDYKRSVRAPLRVRSATTIQTRIRP